MEPWAQGLPKDPKYHDYGSTGGRPTTNRLCRPTVPTGLSDHRRRGTMKPLAYRLPNHGLIMLQRTDNRPRRGLPDRPGPWADWMRWPTSSIGTQPSQSCARVSPDHGHTASPTYHGQCGGPEVASPSCAMEYVCSLTL